MKKKNKGFTLIEMLVVVLIIGILAGIALPQYQMAVTKAKVASILPIMRRWKDALQEYKLQHGYYCDENGDCPDADTLGVNWPSDWECSNTKTECWPNDRFFYSCFANEEHQGEVACSRDINETSIISITMFQPDDELYEDYRGMITCWADSEKGRSICKALGGKLVDGYDGVYKLY